MIDEVSLRIIMDLPIRHPTINIALEEAIAKHVSDKYSPPTVRFWRDRFSVIVGRSQTVTQEINVNSCKDKVIITRRPSGGGTVIHHPKNLNYSIYLPSKSSKLIGDNPKQYLKPLRKSLQGIGITSRLEPNGLFVDNFKLSGVAQTKRWGFLHHGTLLLSSNKAMKDMDKILLSHKDDYRDKSGFVASKPSPVSNLKALSGHRVPLYPLMDSWIDNLSEFLEMNPFSGTISQSEWQSAEILRENKYSTKEWNYRFELNAR